MSSIHVTNVKDASGNAALVTESGGVKTDKLTGISTAGSISVVGEGNSTTTNLQQGLLKAWTVAASSSAGNGGDSLNQSGFSDDSTGVTTLTLTNPMNHATDYCVSFATISNYPYRGKGVTASTYTLQTVNASGNLADGSANGMVSGDLA